VIRLAAEVAAGQLLFLTNRESKREVLAQVTRIRPFPTGSPYIELEFTEAAPGFWGVEIPPAPARTETRATPTATPALSPTPALAAALMQIVDEVREEPAAVTAAPDAKEVEMLREEVEALREQLLSLKKSSVADVSAALEAVVAETPVAPRPEARRMRLPSADAPAAIREDSHAPSAEAGLAEKTLETAVSEEAEFSAQGLFPEVALDFTKADKAIERGALVNGKSRGTSAGGNLRIVLLGVSLVAVIAGGAWYEGWLPIGARFSSAPPAGAPTRRVTAAPTPQPGAKKAGAIPLDPKNAAAVGTAGVKPAVGAAAPPDGPASPDEAKPAVATAADPESTREETGPAEKTANSEPTAKRANEHGARPADAAEIPTAAGSGATAPPKLIESVKAIPPRGFVTGNVVLDAVVDVSGHVKSMKVLSGPQSLRNAALDALKKYRYAPATQNGRVVQGHVKETVQFWYEP
jgi:protein TonB